MIKPRFLLWKNESHGNRDASLGAIWRKHLERRDCQPGAECFRRPQSDRQPGSNRLVSRCLDGDEAAWEELVRQHTRQVYGLCFRFTEQRAGSAGPDAGSVPAGFQDHQDLSQSAEGSFHTWLARVTRNLLIDHYRRTRQERVTDSIEEQLPMLEETGGAAAARPDQALAGREASEILQATLQKLSPDLREAVILRDLQEMEYREIAEVLDIPEGTVNSRINRGRAELARLLRKQKLVV